MDTTINPLMKEVQGFVELIRQEKYLEAYQQYFSKDAQGVENFSFDGNDIVTVGRDSLIAKAKEWESMRSSVTLDVGDPSVFNDNQCIVWMKIITKNEDGSTKVDEEYVLYTRENNKVIEERFFYIMPEYPGTQYDEFARKFFKDFQQPDSTILYKKYFSDNAQSVEAFGGGGIEHITSGKDNLIKKSQQWEQGREIVDGYTKKLSLVNENQFILSMGITAKDTSTSKVQSMDEYVLYTIDGDKISEERFFYIGME